MDTRKKRVTGQKGAVTNTKSKSPKTTKSKTINKTRRVSKTNTRSGGANGSVHANENVTIETHNQQKTARSFSRKRKSSSRQTPPKRVRLSTREASDSSSESDGDSEVPDAFATGDDNKASRRRWSKKGKQPVTRVTINEDSPSDSSDSDADEDEIQQLGNNFAQNIITPGISQQGISLDSLSYQYAEPISTPISAQVTSKIKKKIWKKRFIDLGLLLPKINLQPESQKFALEVGPNADINLVPKTKKRKIFSIEMWTSAFLRYIAIYTEKYPGEIQQLLKYCEIIRDLAQRKLGMAWSIYDQNFRLLRENCPIPWDRIHTEFWIKAATAPIMDSPRQQSKPFRGQQDQLFRGQQDTRTKFLEGTCWKYNKRGHCGMQTCKFEHKCGICKGGHTAARCTQAGRPDKPANPISGQSQSPSTAGPNKQPNRSNSGN